MKEKGEKEGNEGRKENIKFREKLFLLYFFHAKKVSSVFPRKIYRITI
jgi:hypothetical protein